MSLGEIWNRDSQNMGCSWWSCHCTPVLLITPESFKYRKRSQPVSVRDSGREAESKHTGRGEGRSTSLQALAPQVSRRETRARPCCAKGGPREPPPAQGHGCRRPQQDSAPCFAVCCPGLASCQEMEPKAHPVGYAASRPRQACCYILAQHCTWALFFRLPFSVFLCLL